MYVNISGQTRVWPNLTNNTTGRTLRLAPGESAEIREPVNDPRLRLVKPKRTEKKD